MIGKRTSLVQGHCEERARNAFKGPRKSQSVRNEEEKEEWSRCGPAEAGEMEEPSSAGPSGHVSWWPSF